jgi:hypothetical protein
MKKVIIASLALFCITVSSYAQGGFRLGIKGGANMNKISGVSFEDGYDLAYHLGGFAEIDFTKKIGIQPEVLFNQSTSTTASGYNSIYQNLIIPNQNITLNYLSIPILLRWNVGELITLNAGPQFGILLNKDEHLLQSGQSAFTDGDFSMVAGLQFNLKTLRIYGRYNIGMKNINDYDQKDKWTNQQIQLGVGLKL